MGTLAIFVDGAYIFKLCQNHFGGVRLDHGKMSEEIRKSVEGSSREPVERFRTYLYDCPPYQSSPPTEAEKIRTSGYDSFKWAVSRIPRFEVREGRLQYRGQRPDGGPDFVQKRVDLLLGLDIALLSAKQQITHMALLAGDGDFLPAVKVAKQEGVSLWLLHGPQGSYSGELWQEADERIELDTAFMNAVRRT